MSQDTGQCDATAGKAHISSARSGFATIVAQLKFPLPIALLRVESKHGGGKEGAVLGITLGSEVIVGTSDGETLKDGVSEGEEEGKADGAELNEGESDGMTEGAEEGSTLDVGEDVGEVDGNKEGAGNSVGNSETEWAGVISPVSSHTCVTGSKQ